MSDKEENENWLEEFANMSVGGRYLPSAEGLVYTFIVPDLKTKPKEIIKDYEGNKSKKKQWNIVLKAWKWHKDAYKEILEDKKGGEKKLNSIDALEVDAKYLLELSLTASKQLGAYILANKVTNTDEIKFIRLGSSYDTEYKFKKAE